MTEELSKTEARQGDQRRTNRTALVIGIPLAVIILALLMALWAT